MDAFVARQPIFTRNLQVYGYELLFRQDQSQPHNPAPGDLATSLVLINSFALFGLETLTGGKYAFVNFTRNLLVAEVATAFPKEVLAVEVLEDVAPDAEVVQSCQRLKEMGYKLVLDDFVFRPEYEPLIELADIIKIDFLTTPLKERLQLPKRQRRPHLKFLAEKVETQADLQLALVAGYDFIQGFFFSKPETVSARDLPAYKLNYLEMLSELYRPQINFDALERIILREVSFSYKLLRFVNSAYLSLRHEVSTVRQGMILLGTEEIRKWVSLMVMSCLGADKPAELAILAAMRARFCELIGVHSGLEGRRTDLYLMGLFSLIDAFTDRSLADVLAQLPLQPAIKQALQGEEDSAFSPVYTLVLAYETADWAAVTRLAARLHLSEQTIANLYQQALDWTHHIALHDSGTDTGSRQRAPVKART